MKKLKLSIISLSLLLFAAACSNDNDEVEDTNPDKETEKQIENIIEQIEKETNLTAFSEALQTIDMSKLEGDKFTVLAYKDEAIDTRASQTNGPDNDIFRHIIKGKYTFEELKTIEKLTAVSNDILYIAQAEDGSLTINGVKIGKEIASGSSTIFVVESAIPKENKPEIPQKEYKFIVYNINTKWSPENNKEYESAAENINIKIFKETVQGEIGHIETLKTDEEGKAIFKTSETDEAISFYYEVEEVENKKANSCLGYKISGLFTSEEQLYEYRYINYSPTGIRKKLGEVMLVDLDGDGEITEQDQMISEGEPLTVFSEETTVIYLVPDFFGVNFSTIEIAFIQARDATLDIDMFYDTFESRRKLNQHDNVVYDMWDKSYNAIVQLNGAIEEFPLDEYFVDNRYKLMYQMWRAEMYFSLATIYGNIPLQTGKIFDRNKTQSTQNEIYEYLIEVYERLMEQSDPNIDLNLFRRKLGLIHRAKKNYQTAYVLFREIIDGRDAYFYTDIADLLLTADMALILGKNDEALRYVNYVREWDRKDPITDPSSEVILKAIKDRLKYNPADNYIQTLNAMAWDEMEHWGKYALIPIPQKAIEQGKTGVLKQNPGW